MSLIPLIAFVKTTLLRCKETGLLMKLERILGIVALGLVFIGVLALQIWLSLMTYPGPN